MIKRIDEDQLNIFNNLLKNHLSHLTNELSSETNARLNQLLRAEISNVTTLINGLSKHKLFITNYEAAVQAADADDDEKPKKVVKKAPKKRVAAPAKPRAVKTVQQQLEAENPFSISLPSPTIV